MDKGFLIKDFAQELGVTEDTVINFEKRWRKQSREYLESLRNFIPKVKMWENIPKKMFSKSPPLMLF
jgi:hypothetical protein